MKAAPRTEKRTEKLTNAPAERPAKTERSPINRELRATRPAINVPPKRPIVSTVPRQGTQPPLKTEARPSPKPQWNADWRKKSRYDWHNWRRHHRHRYHLHAYSDPFGWGYFRYWIGWRLWPGYYGSRYWIVDPWYYRLPPAPPGTRWVRYYNDALLVDIWTGEVLDVIHDFFW